MTEGSRLGSVVGNVLEVDWRATGAATAAHYLLGALWYAPPVFGKQWAQAIGFTAPEDNRTTPALYVGPLVGSFLASVATATLARAAGARTLPEGLSLGLLVGAGYGVGLSATYAVSPNNPRPGRLLAITGAYQCLGFSLIGGIVTAWSRANRSK